MTYSVFPWAFLLFAGSWFFHFIWWRLKRPRDDLTALAFCLNGIPFLLAPFLFLTAPLTGEGVLYAFLLAEAVGLTYVFWYPAAQAVSPTMLITIVVHRAGKAGIDGQSLKEILAATPVVHGSIDNLFEQHFAIEQADDSVVLAPRGRRFYNAVSRLRKFAGFSEPKG